MQADSRPHTPSELQAHVAQLFAQQQAYFLEVQQVSRAADRLGHLRRLRQWIVTHRSEIQDAIYADFRKPRIETDLTEVKATMAEIDHVASHLRGWMRTRTVPNDLFFAGTSASVVHEPKGVSLIFGPFNFPFMLAVGPLVSALAAGCCAILKPSEQTPNTAALIARMAGELFPPGLVAVVEGDAAAAEALLALPFDHIFFTGSPGVGKKVMHAAADHLASVTLELGGMNPVIVDETANLRDAATKLIWGKCVNAGQSCMSINLLWVQASVYEKLLAELTRALGEMYGAQSPAHEDMASIVNTRHYARLHSLLDDALAQGATLAAGGTHDPETRYFAPSILRDVPLTARLVQEEIFGPILPVRPYETLGEVVAFIRTQPKPLALNMFSASEANIDYVMARTSAGTTCINDTTLQFQHPNLPFGGVNNSGIGKAHGQSGFLEFTNQRSVLRQRVGLTAAKLVYPPYKKQVQQTVDMVVKYL